jgi:hypothetical protein
MGKNVVIVGAGLAGLTCARALRERGIAATILEAGDGIGGRVRTDLVDGFPLDRGFQVLLTAYPEAQRWLDYDALDLQRFYAGALVHTDTGLHRLADPWSHPVAAVASLFGPVGTTADKLRIAWLRARLAGGSTESLLARPETTSAERLAADGFSADMLRRFLRPFFGGVFLERDLTTTSRMLEFTFRMFASGAAAVPAAGMGQIPAQLASPLPAGSLRTGVAAAQVTRDSVTTVAGEHLSADAVVVATDARSASRLLGTPAPAPGRNVLCLYFAAADAPAEPYTLVLDGEGDGPVNNVCVRPGLPGSTGMLVSASLLEPYPSSIDAAVDAARAQLGRWFGAGVGDWRFLRAYDVRDALPDQSVGALDPQHEQPRLESGVFICGDWRQVGSINGAMVSGRHAAEAVATALG